MEYNEVEELLASVNTELENFHSEFRITMKEDDFYVVLMIECKTESTVITMNQKEKRTLTEAWNYLSGIRAGLNLSRI
jgi:hypothetical protein